MIEYRTNPSPRFGDETASRREVLNEKNEAMDVEQLAAMVDDIRWQPDWRSESDLDAAYYDGYQITPETQARAHETGQPVAVVNLIFRAINTMLGQEAKARSSWKLSADQDQFADVAEALQVRLTEAQRETYADMAISEAYGSQVKPGIGWVEVSKRSDLFAPYPFRVEQVHRNEMWWDWRAKMLSIDDARWVCRQRWIDQDESEAMFPEHRDILRNQVQGWSPLLLAEALSRTTPLHEAYNDFRRFRVEPDEWLDTGRKRIRFYEVWYRVMADCVALVLSNGSVREFDPKNMLHREAVARNMGRLVKTWRRKLRCALFAGPHRLFDHPSKRKRPPYIPFWAYRDDANRTPYGMVRGMRYPQDEYNARRSKLMWLLQAAQVLVDNDALDTEFNSFRDLANEIMRPDMLMVLNANRKQKEGIQIRRDISLPKEQFEVMQDAKILIQEQPGIYGTMLGDAPTGVTSGLAINSLVEQGVIAQGELNDNYRYARRMVGEALVDEIVEDIGDRELEVMVGVGASKRVVLLNQRHPQLDVVAENKVADAPIKVALDEMPNTPAYRLQQQKQLADVLQVGGQDPAVRAVLIPSFIEATDLPNREHDARLLRQMYGVPAPGDTQALEDRDKQAQQGQQNLANSQVQANQAAAAEASSKAMLDESTARLNLAKSDEINLRNAAVVQPQAPTQDQLIQEILAEAQAAPA